MELDLNKQPSPYGHPMQMVDRVHSFDPDTASLVACKAVCRNEPLIQGHFPGFPILPGILQIESIAQCSSILLDALDGNAELTPMVVVESRVKHEKPVLPGDVMVIETKLIERKESSFTFRARISVGGEEAAKGQVVLERFADRRARLAGDAA